MKKVTNDMVNFNTGEPLQYSEVMGKISDEVAEGLVECFSVDCSEDNPIITFNIDYVTGDSEQIELCSKEAFLAIRQKYTEKHYTLLEAISSDPHIAGMEFIYPDLTVLHLKNGQVVGISGECLCLYENAHELEETNPTTCIDLGE